jgi:hypothetical protein
MTADLDLAVALDPANLLAAIGALEKGGFVPSLPVWNSTWKASGSGVPKSQLPRW